MAAADIEAIVASVAAERDPARKVEALVAELAERIKATSNDQNVQRLARELTAAAPVFASAMVAEADARA